MSRVVTLTKKGYSKTFDADYIMARVTITDTGCWEWNSFDNHSDGRGVCYWGQVREVAYRVSYQVFIGDIPDGLSICHHCDNPPCVNPEHLYAGTQADNVRDMVKRGRNKTEHLPHGFPPPNTRPADQVRLVKAASAGGMSSREISRILNIPGRTVRAWIDGLHQAQVS